MGGWLTLCDARLCARSPTASMGAAGASRGWVGSTSASRFWLFPVWEMYARENREEARRKLESGQGKEEKEGRRLGSPDRVPRGHSPMVSALHGEA